MSDKKNREKKFYKKPKLHSHGDISEITLGGPNEDFPDTEEGVSGGWST